MKIGLIRETKSPVDNRVAFTPGQLAYLKNRFPQDEFVVQSSQTRAYTDEEYTEAGIEVTDNLDKCDILFGIKEASVESIIPGKHYIFFGHIAKRQSYNIPLFKGMLEKGVTFTDYEYLTDKDGCRVAAFGWYAGIVGVYYTLRGWGLRNRTFTLPMPDLRFTVDKAVELLRNVDLSSTRIIVTGAGRVSHGAAMLLDRIGINKLTVDEFLTSDRPGYCMVDVDQLVKRKDGEEFSISHFLSHPQEYCSDFDRFIPKADILISGHLWQPGQPVYIDFDNLSCQDTRIKMIGDITCDIQGSIKTTLRSSTHASPYFDVDLISRGEAEPFSSHDNLSVMAVDTCPNSLPREASEFFGEQLIKNVVVPLLENHNTENECVSKATIIRNGKLSEAFSYLSEYVESFMVDADDE